MSCARGMATNRVASSASECGIGLVVDSETVSHFTGKGARFVVFGFEPSKKTFDRSRGQRGREAVSKAVSMSAPAIVQYGYNGGLEAGCCRERRADSFLGCRTRTGSRTGVLPKIGGTSGGTSKATFLLIPA